MLRHCSVLGFSCSIFCLLRHYTISSRFPLFHFLFVTSLLCSRHLLFHLLFVTSIYYLFQVSIVSLCVCYVIALFWVSIHLLFVTSLYHFFNVSIVSLLVCYITVLFSASIVPSSVCYVTIRSLHGFHCFIICMLRHCSVRG